MAIAMQMGIVSQSCGTTHRLELGELLLFFRLNRQHNIHCSLVVFQEKTQSVSVFAHHNYLLECFCATFRGQFLF